MNGRVNVEWEHRLNRPGHTLTVLKWRRMDEVDVAHSHDLTPDLKRDPERCLHSVV